MRGSWIASDLEACARTAIDNSEPFPGGAEPWIVDQGPRNAADGYRFQCMPVLVAPTLDWRIQYWKERRQELRIQIAMAEGAE
jgi:hypothetical protein